MSRVLLILIITATAAAHICDKPIIPDFLLSPISPKIDSKPSDIIINSGWTGIGGGSRPDANNSWYATDIRKPIEYCIVHSPYFPVSKTDAEAMVLKTIEQWKKFFSKYQMRNQNFTVRNKRIDLSFPGKAQRSLNLEFRKTTCAHNENPSDSKKLIILFGMTNPLLETYQRFSNEVELGFAVRGPYDHQSYRNGGYIWIGGFSSDMNRVRHILLHEFGHVFGMSHNSVFVMDEHVATDLLRPGIRSDYFGRIESATWKYKVTAKDPISLTADRSKLAASGAKSGCAKYDARAGASLPKELRRALRLRDNHCYRMKFVSGPSNRSARASINLSITDLKTGRTKNLRGVIEHTSGRPNAAGPGIYSKYTNQGRSKLFQPHVIRRVLLDSSPGIFPARGYLKYGWKQFPVQISNQNGLEIEMFLNKSARWWTITE